jgi:zinc protease
VRPSVERPAENGGHAGKPAANGVVNPGLAPVRQQFPNGTVVTAKESRAMPAVTIQAAFAAGSVFDAPDRQGLAHFVSRVLDRGTESRSADDIAVAMEDRGASLTATVNRHILSLACTCLVEDFEDMLAIVGDVAMHATFPADQIAIRRAEIVTTIRQDEDNPAAMAGERLMQELYPGHPYALRPRGTIESVESMPDGALRDFYHARCVPAALSLAVVGDVDAGHAIDCAHRVFGSWRRLAPAPLALPAVAPLSSRRRVVLPMMNKAQADIAYGFSTILRTDPQYYAYWLMNNILGQYSLGGRLGHRIRERQGMAYYVYSVLDANVTPGPLTIRAGVNAANVDRAVQSIDDELARMASEGVTDKELSETKGYLVGSMPRTLETNAGIANFLQSAEFFTLGLDYDLRLPGLLARVTRDDVHEAARRTLDPSRAAVVIAGPYSDLTPGVA